MAPGQRMLFAAGSTCKKGTLIVGKSGTEDHPLVFATDPSNREVGDATTQATIDGGTGAAVSDAIKIVNQSYVTVEDLRLTNSTPKDAPADEAHAVRAIAKQSESNSGDVVMAGITLNQLTIENIGCTSDDVQSCWKKPVGGDSRGRYNAAVVIEGWKGTNPGGAATGSVRLRNIAVKDSTFTNIAGQGVRTWNEWNSDGTSMNRTTGFTLERNTFDFATASAWGVAGTDGAKIVKNTMRRFSMDPTVTSAGGSLHYTNNTLIERNFMAEGASYPYTRCLDAWGGNKKYGCNPDGQAIDIGVGVQNTIVQHNVSTDNGRGFLMLCAPAGPTGSGVLNKAAHTIIRYNISKNDHLYGIRQTCGQGQADTHIYGNTFYTRFPATSGRDLSTADTTFAVFANVDVEAPDNTFEDSTKLCGGSVERPTTTCDRPDRASWNAQPTYPQDQMMYNNLIVNESPSAKVRTMLRSNNTTYCPKEGPDKDIPCFSQRGYQSGGNVFQGDVTDYAFATAAPGLEGSTGVAVDGTQVTGPAGLRNPDTALTPGSGPDFDLAAPGFTLIAEALAAGHSTPVPTNNLPTVGTRNPDANPLPGLWSEITAPNTISAADFYGSTVPITPPAPGADTAPLTVSSPNRGSTVPAGYVTFTGQGTPGGAIEIKGAVRVVATTHVDADGSWSAMSTFTLDGDYDLTVTQSARGIDTHTTVPFRARS